MSCYSNFEFYAGEDKTLYTQLNLVNKDGCREPFDLTGATEIEVHIPSTGADIVKKFSLAEVVVDNAPLAKIHVDYLPADTTLAISGTLFVYVTRGGKTTIFVATAAVRRLEIQNC